MFTIGEMQWFNKDEETVPKIAIYGMPIRCNAGAYQLQ